MKRILTGAFVLWATIMGALHASDPMSYRLRFGIVSEDSNGKVTFVKETNVLPLRFKEPKILYGTEIVPPDDKPYSYYCVFHVSKAPKVLTGQNFSGKEPSTTIQTNPVNVPGGTYVDENWFDPGDPLGDCSVDVFIDGKLIKTFKYKVVSDN